VLLIVAMASLTPAPAQQKSSTPEPPLLVVDTYCLPDDPHELLRLDDEMRAFFSARVRDSDSRELKLEGIVADILGEEGLHFRYEADGIYDVREAFRRRRGNCLTFSALFIAVAREFHLPAQFNLVATQPSWGRSGGIVLEIKHVNARVDLGRSICEIDLGVDGDLSAPRRMSRPIEDRRALSGIYSTAGVYRLAAGDSGVARRLLRLSVGIDPGNTAAWTNLGGAYLVANEPEQARECYERALIEDPSLLAAISGLARIERDAGRIDLAERLERKAARYRERNPYYLLFVAREELAAGKLEAARRHLDLAIRIKSDEPDILAALAETFRALGRERDAERWAKRLASLRTAAR
jgi:tetratricopeptide (TPR) repeat protein